MNTHNPVLLTESIQALAIKPEGIYIDGTYGRGGHSKAILSCLSPKGRLIAIDKDEQAVTHAQQLAEQDARFEIVRGSYADIEEHANALQVYGLVDGILLDCGVSSPQLDQAERGFSFMQDGPLDMRMDRTAGIDAQTWINQTKAEEMADVFKRYGEERYARRIANAIVKARETKAFTSTVQLAEVVKQAHPRWEKHKHPATRVFQAIRIEVNDELHDLKRFLAKCLDVLNVGGRLAVISFHSLEDRLVKQFMKQAESGPMLPKEIPLMADSIKVRLKRISRKGIKAGAGEISENVRARSAVLRVGEKLR